MTSKRQKETGMNKGKLKQKFAVLTDNDLRFEEGKKEEMIGSFKLRLAKQRELHKIIGAF